MTGKLAAICMLSLSCLAQLANLPPDAKAEVPAAGRSRTSANATSRSRSSTHVRVDPRLAAKVRRVLDN